MSLLPYVVSRFSNQYDPMYDYMFDQNFGLGLLNDDDWRVTPSWLGFETPFRSGYMRTLRHMQPEDSGVSAVSNTKDEFKVSLDVQQFKPEEIKVKVAGDYVIIEGNHEEREDEHGYISRQFMRKYRLPPNVKSEAITSSVSSDGLLQIVAPKKVEAIKQKEREIKVTQTKQPAIKEKKRNSDKLEKMES